MASSRGSHTPPDANSSRRSSRRSRFGARLVIINRDPTPLDEIADLVIREGIGPTLADVNRRLSG